LLGIRQPSNALGFLYVSGQAGVIKNTETARYYFKKSYDNNIALGCYNLGSELKKEGLNEKASTHYVKSCKLDYKDSCNKI